MRRRSAIVAARLGVDLEEGVGLSGKRTFDRNLCPVDPHRCPITVLLGPSGAGKTTLLRAQAHEMKRAGWRIARKPRALPPTPAIDLLAARGKDIDAAMALLTRAGLGEAHCFVAPANQLSTGQQARLRLLLAMTNVETGDRAQAIGNRSQVTESSRLLPVPCHTSPVPRALILDEFASSLDDATARGICAFVARWARREPGRRVVLATHREHLVPLLAPCTLVRLALHGAAHVERIEGPPNHPLAHLTIEPGEPADLEALLPYHYRAGRPATIAGLWRALDRENDPPNLAGILSVSMPTLNARWRELAWPARYTIGSKARRARRLNREVRCISRVIIDPRYRGMGLARRLVRTYLDSPLTPCTESMSSMGSGAMFFERAGMTCYPLAPTERDARLLDALAHLGIEPHEVCAPRRLLSRVRERGAGALLERELNRWARTSRAGIPVLGADEITILRRAARTIAGAPLAFAYTSSQSQAA